MMPLIISGLCRPICWMSGLVAGMDNGTFKIQLSGIYWNPNDPNAPAINGENYHVGEVVLRHRSVEIRKTEVVFEDPMGEKVVKYFYDYLDTPKKGNR